MKTLTYGIICEDAVHFHFIEQFLPLALEHLQRKDDLTYELEQSFNSRFRARNRKEVENNFVEACVIGFRDYPIDVIFVGLDYDDGDQAKFDERCKDYFDEIADNLRNKCLIFLPVQCIEHWLWYVKWKEDNPHSTKNESLEKKSRREAKTAVYGKAKVSSSKSVPLVIEYTNKINVEWLESRSHSFGHFLKLMKRYLESLD